jgi:hypothetical protein
MEVLTVIAAAVAFAGGEAAKAAIGEAVNDAYRALKNFLARRYPQVDLGPVEKAPESTPRQAVLAEDLTNSEAAADPEFALLAKRLVDAVAGEMGQGHGPGGVTLDDFAAASLRIDDVIAAGAGVVIRRGRIDGHVEITHIRAGGGEEAKSKKS